MGIQLTVELNDLPENFTQEINKERQYQYDADGNESFVEVDVLDVTFPSGRIARSYYTDALVFDNKNANMEYREELDVYRVPYVRR